MERTWPAYQVYTRDEALRLGRRVLATAVHPGVIELTLLIGVSRDTLTHKLLGPQIVSARPTILTIVVQETKAIFFAPLP